MISVQDCQPWEPEDADVKVLKALQHHFEDAFDWNSNPQNIGAGKISSVLPARDDLDIRKGVVDHGINHILTSAAWAVKKMSPLLLLWIQQQFALDGKTELYDIAGGTLYRMLVLSDEALDISRMLEKWKS
ncbi:hypothetical protein MMC19_004672 [Ptychographa xylographoides]|nr:hypothetical protein [Ptychographa xylographoides]